MRAAALLALGLFLGSVGALVQTCTTSLGSLTLPTGTLLVLATLVPVARAGAWWLDSRWGAIALSVGWLAATLLMGTTTSGGDLVISSGTRQIAYLVGGTVLLSAACGYPLLAPEEDEPVAVAVASSDD